MQRLLILSCAQRKRRDSALLPAVERYDGPLFQVIRKYLREFPEVSSTDRLPLRVCVLSASFGLIDGSSLLPYYDQRMTPARAQELRASSLAALEEVVKSHSFSSTFVSLGRDYWPALEGWQALVAPGVSITIATGSVGRRAATLREWLQAPAPPSQAQSPLATGDRSGWDGCGTVRLCGREWSFQAHEVLALARQRLEESRGAPEGFHSWCVPVDGRCVAPKWLVSQVTGLPHGDFSTDAARRALLAWGVPVRRNSLLSPASCEEGNAKVGILGKIFSPEA